MKRKIYLASSWRNNEQQGILQILRKVGHEVYDFKNPGGGNTGFSWSEVDPNWQNWSTEDFYKALFSDAAKRGFALDFQAMHWADTCVLLLPCGRSAHIEAGWMKGAGKQVFVFSPLKQEPELMYKMVDGIHWQVDSLLLALNVAIPGVNPDNDNMR